MDTETGTWAENSHLLQTHLFIYACTDLFVYTHTHTPLSNRLNFFLRHVCGCLNCVKRLKGEAAAWVTRLNPVFKYMYISEMALE